MYGRSRREDKSARRGLTVQFRDFACEVFALKLGNRALHMFRCVAEHFVDQLCDFVRSRLGRHPIPFASSGFGVWFQARWANNVR